MNDLMKHLRARGEDEAADEIERLSEENAKLAKLAMQACDILEQIAAPMRADGTWNRDREACQQLALRFSSERRQKTRTHVRGRRTTDN